MTHNVSTYTITSADVMCIFMRYRYMKNVIFILLSEAVIICVLSNICMHKSNMKRKNTEKAVKMENLISKQMKCFPIPISYRDRIYYTDTYGAARQNGNSHEGCDLMDEKNSPGEIPIVSATDGVVTNLGWLYLGGYRIGITDKNNIYYYYAHLNSYAAGLEAGDSVKAGQLLGFMGNTGEGEEGTTGKFNVHLHFGIYIRNQSGNEETVNAYPYLKNLE